MLTNNKYIWIVIALLTLTNLTIQFFGDLTVMLQMTGWFCWIFLVCILFMLTDKFKELKILISESYTELKKVVWPTKNETIQTALIVIVMVTITGIILWLLDNFMIWLIAKLARIG